MFYCLASTQKKHTSRFTVLFLCKNRNIWYGSVLLPTGCDKGWVPVPTCRLELCSFLHRPLEERRALQEATDDKSSDGDVILRKASRASWELFWIVVW